MMARQLLFPDRMLANLFIAMSAGEVGAKSVESKPGTSHTKKSTSLLDGNTNSSGSGEIATTDNKKLIVADSLVNRQPRNFGHILDKKIVDNTPPETQTRKKSKIQTQGSTMFSGMQSVVPLTVKELPTGDAKSDKADLAKVKNQSQQQVEGVNPGKLARFITNAEIVPSSQIIKPMVSGPENKPLLPTTQKGRITSEAAAPQDISNKSNIIPTQLEKGKDTGKPQLPNKAFVAAENLNSRENGKELLRESLSDNSKINTTGEKQIINNGNKTQISDTVFAALQNQAPNSQQKALINPQNLTKAAQGTTVDRIETDREALRGKSNPFDLQIKGADRFENQSVKSHSQKGTQSQVHLSAAKAESHSDSPSSGISNQDVETGAHVLFSTDNQHIVKEYSPATSGFANTTTDTDSAANVREQILGAVYSSSGSGNEQIVIRLNPPELGKVAVRFQEQSDNVTGIIHVEKPQTKQQIQQALPEIIQNLQNSGVQIKSIEVVLTNQQEQYVPQDQTSAGQNNWSGQQSQPNPEPQRDTYNELVTSAAGVTEIMESHARFFDGSINILM